MAHNKTYVRLKNISVERQQAMIKISTTLRRLMDKKDLSITELASESGIPKETIKTILYQNPKDARLSTSIKLADALNCSLDDLVGRKYLSKEEQHLLNLLKKLPDRSVLFLQEIADLEYHLIQENKKNKANKIPVLAPTKYFCDGLLYDSLFYETVDISYHPYNKIIMCGLKITNNDFAPTYNAEDILLIAKDRPPVQNDCAVYLYEGRLYLRRCTGTGLEPISICGRTLEIENSASLFCFGYVFAVYRGEDKIPHTDTNKKQ